MGEHFLHNLDFVWLSVGVAIFASFTSLRLVGRMRVADDVQRFWWLIAASVALGGGIWAMHFIGMLGLIMPMAPRYDLWLTSGSLLVATGASGTGLVVVMLFGKGWKPTVLAGVVVGLGIVAMHYMGMAGMDMPGLTISYSPLLVAVSVAIALSAATAALWLAFHTAGLAQRLLAAMVMGLAISGMHYVGIAAASFVMDAPLQPSHDDATIHGSSLALAVGAATLALLLLALLLVYFDRRLFALAAREGEALRHSAALLTEQNSRFEWAINNMAQGLCMFDKDRRLVVFNRPYAELYHLQPEQVKLGTTFEEILDQRLAAGNLPLKGADTFQQSRNAVVENGRPRSDLSELEDGRFIQIIHRGLPDGGWVATHQDVTEQRRMEAQIRFLAQHDPLTALPNRSFLQEKIAEVQPRLLAGEVFALLFVDLDRFKPVNDTYGHAVGDSVLGVVARRVSACAGPDALVVRLGGDEFAIVQGPIAHTEEAAALARQIVDSVSKPIEISGRAVTICASVGIAVAPVDGTDAPLLMKNADLALYRAKAGGGGAYRFFEMGLDATLQVREQLERDLSQALAAGELSLVYQPLINLAQDRISGFEALLRWHHPDRGDISPADFIPFAEATGLITAIGDWVINEACRQAARWPSNVFVAVNLSPLQFRQSNLVATVVSALAANNLPAERLEIEITETALLTGSVDVLETLNDLRRLGLKIALDDFGTGFSSLSYLQTFPFDKLKIDRSFIKDIASKPESQAIVKATAELGNSLGMITTAEGVETVAQLNFVRKKGCVEAQGFLFSVPLTASEATKLLERKDGRWGIEIEERGLVAA